MELWQRWWFLVPAAVAGALVVEVARWRLGRWWRRRRNRQRSATARAGEVEAEKLLEAKGYGIVARQPRLTWELEVDGAPRPVEMRADLLVERRGQTYVAEVKTGSSAPRLETAATRRQLLEYRVAYDVDGALLVDMSARRVHRVVFPLKLLRPGPTVVVRAIFWLMLGAALGGSLIWSFLE